MKIYKLDIDVSKPTRQVMQMQQNSEGVISVDVTNDGKHIRNLSCSLYDGDTQVSAIAGNGFKVNVGGETKEINIKADATPIDSAYQYVASSGSG